MTPQTLTKFTLNLMFLTPFFGGGGSSLLVNKSSWAAFNCGILTSLPTTTLPTEYEANRLTPHFQVLHQFLRQSHLSLGMEVPSGPWNPDPVHGKKFVKIIENWYPVYDFLVKLHLFFLQNAWFLLALFIKTLRKSWNLKPCLWAFMSHKTIPRRRHVPV